MSLELGGNSPFMVFDDAKIKAALGRCHPCEISKQWTDFYEEFAKQLTERIKKLKVDAGTEEGTFFGPLSPRESREKDHGPRGRREEAWWLGHAWRCSGAGQRKRVLLPTRRHHRYNDGDARHPGRDVPPVIGLYKFETEEQVIGEHGKKLEAR
jgi:succinate-semialdehyde dehydrogenase/glutarate-semialdehyde dehydrogenase